MGYHPPPMFATLGGAFARPVGTGDPDEMVRRAVEAQEEAGLEPVTDGGVMVGLPAVEAWRRASSVAGRAVKASLVGPYTLARAREASAAVEAEQLREEVIALAAAQCPLVEIVEDAAVRIDRSVERAAFVDAQRRLTDGVSGTHLSLAIRGGSAEGLGAAALFDAAYSSFLFDLIEGPDNWRLVAQAPGDRGIVCGVADARTARIDPREVMVWAAHYAASTGGRGLARVGLATTGSMADLPWDAAVGKIRALAAAADVAVSGSPDEVAAALDPRAVDIRSAAMGRYVPRRRTG